jgi:cytochrome c nitrite reductase small subunit
MALRTSVNRASLTILFACLMGIPAGIGAFTFVYAKGFSYLSTDPRACVNCHIMNRQYDAG